MIRAMNTTSPKIRLSVTVDRDTVRRLDAISGKAPGHIPLSQLINEAARQFVARQEAAQRKERRV
jgi:hypothetical protein